MKNTLLIILACLSLTACITLQERKTYNTLHSVGHAVDTSYKTYNDLIVTGALKTNSFPFVSHVYNSFQHTYRATLLVYNNKKDALAPEALVTQSIETVTHIERAIKEDK